MSFACQADHTAGSLSGGSGEKIWPGMLFTMWFSGLTKRSLDRIHITRSYAEKTAWKFEGDHEGRTSTTQITQSIALSARLQAKNANLAR